MSDFSTVGSSLTVVAGMCVNIFKAKLSAFITDVAFSRPLLRIVLTVLMQVFNSLK
jgi:hypothetical protein